MNRSATILGQQDRRAQGLQESLLKRSVVARSSVCASTEASIHTVYRSTLDQLFP